jgi:zinc protease
MKWSFCFLIGLVFSFSRAEDKVLKNGLRVIFTPSRSPIASAVVFINAGEADASPLVAMLTNRMLLRGTDIRDSQQIVQEVEEVGGKMGTATLLSFSAVSLQAPFEHFQACFGILCECVARASFDSVEIVRMAATMAEEDKRSGTFFTRKHFWGDAELRRRLFSNAGLGEDLTELSAAVSRNQVLDFYRMWYRPKNMVVSVAGRFDKNAILKILHAYWGENIQDPQPVNHAFSLAGPDSSETVIRQNRPDDLVWIGFHGSAFNGERFTATLVLETALADGKASYFPKQCFSGKNNDVDIQSYYQSEPSLGYFAFRVATPPGKGNSAKNRILAELEKIKNQGIPETVFEIGKRKAESKTAIRAQYSIYNAMFTSMTAASRGPVMTLGDLEERIKRLTLPQIDQAAQQLFVHPVVVILQSNQRQ